MVKRRILINPSNKEKMLCPEHGGIKSIETEEDYNNLVKLYVDWDKDIILVEGLFDAFTAGTNAIPLLGSSMHESSALLRKLVDNDAKIYIALDSDAESKSMNIIKKMFGYGLEIYKVDIGPYSDLGEMSQEEFDERKEKAELINSDSYLTKMAMAI